MKRRLADASSFHRRPCTSSVRSHFQFEDCYLPNRNPNALLRESSFLMSHNAATGYLSSNVATAYAKNQQGSLYQQLQDGARALDVRPKLLANGTVVFHHGVLDIHVAYAAALKEVLQWTDANAPEIVLWLPSHFAYESSYSTSDDMEAALTNIYDDLDVPYYSCDDIDRWTTQDVFDNTESASWSGYLLVLLNGDCVKDNWIESRLVTCWNRNQTSCKLSNQPFERLESYVLQSINNPAADNAYTLGPSYSLPFWQAQALFQVTTRSAAMGLAHGSTILQDNEASRVNEKILRMIYEETFETPISLVAADNVQKYGNALTAVLRTKCGQSVLDVCGHEIDFPELRYVHLSRPGLLVIVVGAYALYMMAWYVWCRRRKREQIKLLQHAWKQSVKQCHGGVLA